MTSARRLRREWLLEVHAAALALGFWQALLAVALGQRVPVRVALGIFAAEWVLGLAALGAWVALACAVPGVLRTAGPRRALVLLAIPFATGASWLLETLPLTHLPAAGALWLATSGAAIAVVTRHVGRSGARDLSPGGFARRALAFAGIACTAAAVAERAVGPQPGAPLIAACLGAYAAASAALTLGVLRVEGRATRRTGSAWRLGSPAALAALLAAVALLRGAPGGTLPHSAASGERSSPSATAPNAVLISIDTLRPDHLSSYGYPRQTSPALDRLAAEGMLFENAISTAPWTLPAHGSLFASRFPRELEDYTIAGQPHLTRILRRSGYRTAAFTGGRFLDARRFGEGFDSYVDDLEDAYVLGARPVFLHASLRLRGALRHFGVSAGWLNGLNHWRTDERPGRVSAWAGPLPSAQAAAAWLAEFGPDGPFFLFFHSFGVHEYYLNTAEVRREARRWLPEYRGWLRGNNLRYGQLLPRRERDLAFLTSLYDGAIRTTDAAVGAILDALEAEGLARNTLVVVVSDHGEGFDPDRERTWHRLRLHDDLIRVPLIARLPAGARAGDRVAAQVSLVDVAPSILDVLGLPPLAEARGRPLWNPASGGEGKPGDSSRYALSEAAEYWDGFQATSVRSRRFKYVRRERRQEEFYDLAEDPAEARNLAHSGHPALPALRGALEDLGRAPAVPKPDRETLATLRALGYVDAR